jgi:hypothetical protein
MKSTITLALVTCLAASHVPLHAHLPPAGPFARALADVEPLAASPMPQPAPAPPEAAALLELRWEELQPLILGQRVTVTLADGASVQGDVLAVRDDALVVDVGRRPVPAAVQPGGRLPRSAVATIRLERTGGAGGRNLGTIIGVLTGVVVGGYVTSQVADSAGTGIPLFLGLASAITAGGYYAGRRIDRRITIIRVVS